MIKYLNLLYFHNLEINNKIRILKNIYLINLKLKYTIYNKIMDFKMIKLFII